MFKKYHSKHLVAMEMTQNSEKSILDSRIERFQKNRVFMTGIGGTWFLHILGKIYGHSLAEIGFLVEKVNNW